MSKINPGIVNTVRLLNSHGFPTCDSGDGMTRDFECDRAEPYVVVRLDDPHEMVNEARRLRTLLESLGVQVGPVGQDRPCIQADYDPVAGIAFLQLMGLKDDDYDSKAGISPQLF